MKKMKTLLILAALWAPAQGGPNDGLYANEREFSNATRAEWRVRLEACRDAGGVDVYRGLVKVARLARPGDEIGIPEGETRFMRYLSLDDVRFALVDHTGNDGGVVFQVGRQLQLIPAGAALAPLDELLDRHALGHGNVDLWSQEWPD